MSDVLAVGDIHEPVSRKGYLKFNKDIRRKKKCDTVVLIGDVVDWSAITFHTHNPEAPGAMDEYTLALEKIQMWYKAFPDAYVCVGNHDARPRRVAEAYGIPGKFIRDYAELWKTPRWRWVRHVVIDDVFYCHGHKKGGGKTPAWNLSAKMGMSVVMGHCHSKGGINWSANPLRRWFGMDTGCGIDDEAYAFAYAEEQITRSILSSGVVLNGVPEHIIMQCGKGEKYHDSNF
jgi:predicted phosphodiesterase